MKRTVRFISSKKVGIVLLICIAFTSIIGTVIAQKQNPVAYIKHFGEFWFKLFNLMGFFDVYHSWWFVTLLILFSINLFFCILNRLNADLKRNKPKSIKIDKEKASLRRLSKKKMFNKPFPECKEIVIKNLKRKIKRVIKEEKEGNGELFLFTERNRINWLFFHFTHISILIILFGAILTSIFGIKGYIQIIEGESSDKFYEYNSNRIRDLGFTVKCEKFEMELYPDSMRPKDYKSSLIILDKGKEILKKVIEVNKPLTYKGMTLYQSSYGEDTSSGTFILDVKPIDPNLKEPIREFRIRLNEEFEFAGGDGKKRRVSITKFFPDFMINEQREAFSRSNQLNNPAIRLIVSKEGEEPFQIWSFLRFSDPHMMRRGDYFYTFKDYQSRMYTGLQVGSNPWVWIVWIGSIFLVLGVTLLLFTSHQRIWVILTPVNKGCSVMMVGASDKNKFGFEIQFNDLWEAMVKSL